MHPKRVVTAHRRLRTEQLGGMRTGLKHVRVHVNRTETKCVVCVCVRFKSVTYLLCIACDIRKLKSMYEYMYKQEIQYENKNERAMHKLQAHR